MCMCSAYFLGYNYAKDKLSAWNHRQPASSHIPEVVIPMLAGLFADVIASPLWTPADVLASRMQIQGMPGATKYRNTFHAFQHVLQAEGMRGLFRGLGASIATFGPASAIWWGLYEAIDTTLHRQLRERAVAAHTMALAASNTHATGAGASPPLELALEHKVQWVIVVAGMVAGAVSSLVTNPLDIAKTRLQTQHSMIVDYEQAQERAFREKQEREVLIKRQRRLNFFKSLKAFRDNWRYHHQQRAAAAEHTHHHKGKPASGSGSSVTPTVSFTAAAGSSHSAGTHTSGSPPLNSTHTSSGATHGSNKVTTACSAAVAPPHNPPATRAAAPSIGVVPFQSTLSTNRAVILPAAVSTRAAIVGFEQERVGRRRKAPTSTTTPTPGNMRSPGQFYPSIARKLNTSMVSILAHMWRVEGPASWLRGIFPRMTLNAVASACTFLCYEEVKRLSRISPNSGASSSGSELMR